MNVATANAQTELLLKTGTPKRTNETAMSYLVSWRKADSNLYNANGLAFIKGTEDKKPTSAVEVARKITKSINAGINYEAPNDRGATAQFNNDKAEVTVSNKNGFNLVRITVRDYSNQEQNFSIPGKSFTSASAKLAIDIVYSAAVEYMDGFATKDKLKAAGGIITVTIDNDKPIVIKTDAKSTSQIENELAKALGSIANYSSTAIYPNFEERKSRNYKSFDGGEVQIPNLNAKSITIDVNDSGLGVLTKFKFPDANKPTEVAGNVPYFVGFFIVAVLGGAFYFSKNKNTPEQPQA